MDARSAFRDAGKDMSRLGALSDAVFGVALTLLALELRLPESAERVPLAQALVHVWPKFWGYAVTFAVVGAFWISHHQTVRHIVRYNQGLLWLNLAFLSFIALVPFPTTLVGRFGASRADLQLAWIIYSLNIVMIGLSLFWLWRHALSRGLTSESLTPQMARYLGVRGLVTPAVFLLSIAISFANPVVASISPLLILPAMRMVGRAYSRVE